MSILSVKDLSIHIRSARPVDGVSFDIAAGECFTLLGESGCGKSMTALGLMRLLPAAAEVAGGSVRFAGRELLALPESGMRDIRGGGIGMIFQEPATSLNPVLTVGRQIVEALELHSTCAGRRRASARRNCSTRSAFPIRGGALTSFPSSFPAASGSA
jgi:peptide/nickel transport system ATP-binding protein